LRSKILRREYESGLATRTVLRQTPGVRAAGFFVAMCKRVLAPHAAQLALAITG
jgi:hypothetical protein